MTKNEMLENEVSTLTTLWLYKIKNKIVIARITN